jgi:nucleoside 2-deoxyribosyltransferase
MPVTTQPKPFCFVLMPFAQSFTDVYNLGIKETCEQAGAYCERVDEQVYGENILTRVYNQIAKADFIIADMSNKNPNVFYEVGYAHAIGKSTILLTQNNDDIPFDLKHFPHVVYSNITSLKQDLKKWVEWNILNPKVKIENKLSIEVFYKDKNLATESVSVNEGFYPDVPPAQFAKFTIYNNSTETFRSGDFKISVITSQNFLTGYVLESENDILSVRHNIPDPAIKASKITLLPDSNKLFNLPDFQVFYPYDYTSFLLYFIYDRQYESEKIIIRLYTAFGTRDYECFLKGWDG